jgi:DNA helicase-2/ATP-dependent DNA helicase PcrA
VSPSPWLEVAGGVDGSAAPAPVRRPAGPGAREIAEALGQPPPTPEQVAVIEAPLAPLLVVAGAGSGKTETMAARVVWLVAGGQVAPDGVLGLTFTRKAAGELAERVRRRLRALRAAGLWTPDGATDAADVTVSTYHAYAGRLVREHGLRLGVEPEARLLSEAAAWQLAHQVVERWTGEMDSVDWAVSTVVEAVLTFSGECAEHLVDPADVETWLAARIERVAALPYDDRKADGRYADIRTLLQSLQARRQLVPVVQAYRDAKRRADSLDFADQLEVAARLARSVPSLVTAERQRFPAVLLDEYQDTSTAQLEMLHALFGDAHGVTAVGDPNQSIYGWRGASAGTLVRFADRFRTRDGERAPVLNLSTSWRNDRVVLDAANVISAPLRQGLAIPVRELSPRPGAAEGSVEVRTLLTERDEAAAVADWVAERWLGPDGRPAGVSAAVLCRKRAQFIEVQQALLGRGIPVEVVGLGGLLTTPEVSDLVAALHVVHDPGRGDLLMRLLTGPTCRLGPRDLVALGAWARELHRRRSAGAARSRPAGDPQGVEDDTAPVPGDGPDLVLADAVDESSLVEALDELPPPGWVDRSGKGLSAAAAHRLGRLAGTLRDLRGRTGLALPELVVDVERALLLDVEVAARPGLAAAQARTHLDAIADVAEQFTASAERPTLGAFLDWLDAAAQRERGLEPGQVDVDEHVVQLLTVHAAKGLEWDVVAVPGLVEGTFPSRDVRPRQVGGTWEVGPAKDNGWLADLGALPHALRGDADGLPDVRWSAAAHQKALKSELAAFALAGGAHEMAEERRLAYVALTRARHQLLLTGAVWSSASTPRLPSRFLLELAPQLADDPAGEPAAGVLPSLRVGTRTPLPVGDDVRNPTADEVVSVPWPVDPLGGRRAAVEAGARAVQAAMARAGSADSAREDVPGGGPGRLLTDAVDGEGTWSWEVRALLAERDRGRRRTVEVTLPAHLSASRLVRLADDPRALALDVRRPVPREPSPAVRRGTAFHAWVEQHLAGAAIVDVLDLPGAADDEAADPHLAVLQQRFLDSEWAHRRVVAVEVPLETPVDGTVVRGRVDAVFARPDGGVDVVDWKTGTPPTGPRAAARAVQLAAYRLAWHRLHGVPLDRVGAAFFYAATGETVRPVDLLDEEGLVRLLRSVDEAAEAEVAADDARAIG